MTGRFATTKLELLVSVFIDRVIGEWYLFLNGERADLACIIRISAVLPDL